MTASRVLYVLVCGSPAATRVGELVRLAQSDHWDVCVVATPDGRKFIDAVGLARLTGHPVRSIYKNPGDPDVLPAADGMIIAPATVNSVNKLAAGIADTLALGLVIEAWGNRIPIVVLPYTNMAMAAYPAFEQSVRRLREWGMTVLYGPDVLPPHDPGMGASDDRLAAFPWQLAFSALGELVAEGPQRPD